MSGKNRRGRLTPEDRAFIESYADSRDDVWIGEQISRTPDTVRKYRVEFVGRGEGTAPKDIKKIESKYQLKKKVYWEELKRQFDTNEMIRLQEHWADLIDQFNQDVTASEEMQILSVCKIQMLVDRNLCEQRSTMLDIRRLQGEIEKEALDLNPDEDKIREIERILSSYKISAKELTRDFATLNKEHQELWNKLKATRDKRIQVHNDSRSTWNALMHSMLDEQVRQREGRQMAVMKAATDKEYIRLAKYHKFPNDTVDRPILTPETVLMEEDEESCEPLSPESPGKTEAT